MPIFDNFLKIDNRKPIYRSIEIDFQEQKMVWGYLHYLSNDLSLVEIGQVKWFFQTVGEGFFAHKQTDKQTDKPMHKATFYPYAFRHFSFRLLFWGP